MILQNSFPVLLQIDTIFLLDLRKISLESKEVPKTWKTYREGTGREKTPGKFGS